MKRFIFSLLFLLYPIFSFAQNPVLQASFDIRSNSLNTQGFNIASRAISAHIFTWSLQSGVMNSCILSFQTSPNNITWTTQSTGDCTSGGTTSYLIFVTNYVRISATTFTTQSGTPLITINYAGYVIAPTSLATITTAPLNNQNINNRHYITNYSGANFGIKSTACFADLGGPGICDGTGLGAQVITTALTIGTGQVLFLAGGTTITISAVISIIGNGGGIQCDGWHNYIKQAANINLPTFIQINTNPVSATSILRAFIDHCQIDGTSATNGTTLAGIRIGNSLTTSTTVVGVHITNNYIHDIAGEATWADHASGVDVSHNLFDNIGDQAFKSEGGLTSTRNLYNSFNNNVVTRYGQLATGGGVGVQLRNTDLSQVNNNSIGGVVRTSCGSGTSLEAIDILNASYNTISLNKVYNTGAEGITGTNDSVGFDGPSQGNSIVGNIINKPWTSGIVFVPQVDGSATSQLKGNIIADNVIFNANNGIAALSCTLAAGYDNGIRLSGASVIGTSVENNTCVDTNTTRAINYCLGIDNIGALAIGTQVSGNKIVSTDTSGTWDVWRNATGATSDIIQYNRANQLTITPGVNSTTSTIFTKADGTTKVAAIDSTNQFLSTYGKINLFGSSSGNTTIQPAAVASGILTLPNVTDTLVSKTSTDIFTNKTLATPFITRPVAAKTTNYGVSGADSFAYFTNTGAVAEVDFTLPTCAAGLNYSFYVDAAQIVKIVATGGARIRNAGTVGAANGNAQDTTTGSLATIICIGNSSLDAALEWVLEKAAGTWTIN